jgi:hypothetical protein
MNLYYIHLGLDYNDYLERDNKIRYEFQKHTNFIDDYLSKVIRKLKFKTDGTFKMISVSPTQYDIKETRIVPNNVLEVNIPFDRQRYEEFKGSENVSYYLELLENGFKKASDYGVIPLDELLNAINEFRQIGCKNEWEHKKKRFKEENLEISLICEFTTNFFQLRIIVKQLNKKEELLNGIIMRTEAGNSIHEGLYKDIIINKNLIITDSTDSPRIIINKEKLFEGVLDFTINGDKKTKRILSYKL